MNLFDFSTKVQLNDSFVSVLICESSHLGYNVSGNICSFLGISRRQHQHHPAFMLSTGNLHNWVQIQLSPAEGDTVQISENTERSQKCERPDLISRLKRTNMLSPYA